MTNPLDGASARVPANIPGMCPNCQAKLFEKINTLACQRINVVNGLSESHLGCLINMLATTDISTLLCLHPDRADSLGARSENTPNHIIIRLEVAQRMRCVDARRNSLEYQKRQTLQAITQLLANNETRLSEENLKTVVQLRENYEKMCAAMEDLFKLESLEHDRETRI